MQRAGLPARSPLPAASALNEDMLPNATVNIDAQTWHMKHKHMRASITSTCAPLMHTVQRTQGLWRVGQELKRWRSPFVQLVLRGQARGKCCLAHLATPAV